MKRALHDSPLLRYARDELGQRRLSELEALKTMREDRRMIWNGDSGGLFTVSDLPGQTTFTIYRDRQPQ